MRESLIPCVVPTILREKKDGGLRMCTISIEINKITIRYRFPLPRTNDLMDCLNSAKYFSKVELKSGYHHIRIREHDDVRHNTHIERGGESMCGHFYQFF